MSTRSGRPPSAAAPTPAEQFFLRCWEFAREGREIEGSDVQDWGFELGLLSCHEVSAPCGEGCFCDEVVAGDFPTDSYRPTVGPVSLQTEERK